ncbi:hypothetical protein ABPG75_013974 [Micractinium tetrahymenae]
MGQTQEIVQVVEFNQEHPEQAVKVVEGPVPEPGQGEVLVRVQLRPVNPADLFSVQGVYPGFKPEKLPAVPGLDGMGVVERSGPGASKFKPGQRVTATPFDTAKGQGTWQQYVVLPEEKLMAVPHKLSDEAAAQFFVNPASAWVPKGEWLLSNAASSALGRMVIQLGKHYGVRTINLVRSSHHVEDLKQLGADEVVVTTEEDLVERVKEITGGKGAYAALECVGGDITEKVVQATRNGGTVFIYGAMAAFSITVCIPDLLFRDVTLRGFWLNPYLLKAGERRGKILEEVMQLLADGVIETSGGQHFPLDQVADAIQETQTPQRGGKCFLEG